MAILDKQIQDNTRQYNTIHINPRPDKIRQDKARQYGTI